MSDRKRKLLLPVVATLSSALASYLAKKAPQYLEQTVMPKLRDGDSKEQQPEQQQQHQQEPDQSTDELERRRRERADNRASRRKAS